MSDSISPANKEADEPVIPVVGTYARANFTIFTRIGLLAFIALVLASFQLDLPSVLRVPSGIVFMVLMPGLCFMACARKTDTVTIVAMSIALSLGFNVAVALIALWSGFYSAGGLLWLVSGICVAMLLAKPVVENALRYGDAVRLMTAEASVGEDDNSKAADK